MSDGSDIFVRECKSGIELNSNSPWDSILNKHGCPIMNEEMNTI